MVIPSFFLVIMVIFTFFPGYYGNTRLFSSPYGDSYLFVAVAGSEHFYSSKKKVHLKKKKKRVFNNMCKNFK